MKKSTKALTLAAIYIALLFAAFTAFAELSLDSVLLQINASGRNDYSAFKTQMTLSFNISGQRVDYLYTSLRMAPGDIFMTFQVAIICGVPVDRVVKVYKVQRKNGWGVIARELGIKPGSARFKLLKSKANDFYGKLTLKKGDSSKGNSDSENPSKGNKGGKK
ncbi:MAG: hypothetical protein K6U80_05545 [Firmicutes bacterium]|nr:hypothetical protein [Bacillota bacterium]